MKRQFCFLYHPVLSLAVTHGLMPTQLMGWVFGSYNAKIELLLDNLELFVFYLLLLDKVEI